MVLRWGCGTRPGRRPDRARSRPEGTVGLAGGLARGQGPRAAGPVLARPRDSLTSAEEAVGRMLAETPAERGRRLVDGHDDGHDDLDDAADDDDDHDDDHDGSARRVDRITRPRRSRVSSVCGRSGTSPAVRNAAAGPSTRWCRTARRGSHPRQRRERYCSRVREPRLAFGSLRLHARGSRRRVLPLYRCVPAVVSPGIRVAEPVLGRQRASAPPVISTCRVNPPVRRGLGMSRSAPPNAYPKGCTACTAGCSSEAPYDQALCWVPRRRR